MWELWVYDVSGFIIVRTGKIKNKKKEQYMHLLGVGMENV